MKTPMETEMSSFSLGSGGGGENAPKELIKSGGNLEQRIADLEMRPRMPAAGTGIDGDVLALDGPSPRWEPATGTALPNGTAQNDFLVWNTATSSWIKFVGTKDVMFWYDFSTTSWKEIDVPATDGQVLQTSSTEPNPGVKFENLKWR